MFTRVVLPLSVPALAAFAIFQFLWVWNDLLVALVFLSAETEQSVLTLELSQLVGGRGQQWHLLTAGAFVTMIAAGPRVPGPPALLRAGHPVRLRQGLTRGAGRQRPTPDASWASCCRLRRARRRPRWLLRRFAAGHAHGASALPARERSTTSSSSRDLTRATPCARLPTGCRCSSRPTRRAASSSALGHEHDAVPGRHGARRGRRRGADRAGRARPSAGASGAGHHRRLRAGLRPRRSTRATSAWARAPSGRTRTRSRRHAAAFTRGLMRRRAVRDAASTSRASAGSVVDPHHAPGRRRPATGPSSRRGSWCPFRAAIAAGAGMVMSAHVALPGDHGRPRPARDGVAGRHARPAARRPGLPWRLDHRRDGHAARSPRAQRRSSTAIVALRAGRGPAAADPGPSGAAAPRGGPVAGGAARARAGRPHPCGDRPDPAPASLAGSFPRARPWRSSAVRRTRPSRSSRPRRAVTLVRDDVGLLPLRPAPGERHRGHHPAAARPDAGRLVGHRAPRPGGGGGATSPGRAGGPRRRSEPDGRRDRRARVTPSARARSRSSARSRRASSPRRRASSSAVLATGIPTVTVALRTPYDLADYPAAATHLCTYAIVPAAVEALAAALFGSSAIGGRLPVADPRALSSRPWHRSARSRLPRSDRPADDRRPMTLAARSASSPRSSSGSSATRRPRSRRRARRSVAAEPTHVVIAARGTSDHAAIYAQYALGIRAGLSVGLATPSAHSLYGAEPRMDDRPRHRHQPVRARHPTSSASSARLATRARSASPSRTPRARTWRRGGESCHRPAGRT